VRPKLWTLTIPSEEDLPPEIRERVEYGTIPWQGPPDLAKLGDQPCLLEMASTWLPHLRPGLAEVFEADTAERTFHPTALDMCRTVCRREDASARLPALPFSLDVLCLITSAVGSQKAEQNARTNGVFFRDWDAFVGFLRDRKKEGVPVPLMLAKESLCQDVLSLIGVHGGRFVTGDGRSCAGSPATVSAVERLRELFDQGLAGWPRDLRPSIPYELKQYKRAALAVGGLWLADGPEWTALLPPPDSRPVVFVGGTVIGIVRKGRSDHELGGLKQLLEEWLTDKDRMVSLSYTLKCLPPHIEAFKERRQKDPAIWPFVLALSFGASVVPQVPGAHKIEREISRALVGALEGKASAVAATMHRLDHHLCGALSYSGSHVLALGPTVAVWNRQSFVRQSAQVLNQYDVVISGFPGVPLLNAGSNVVTLARGVHGLLVALAHGRREGMTADELGQPYSEWLDKAAACQGGGIVRQVSNLRKQLRRRKIRDLVLTIRTRPARYRLNPEVRTCLLVE
jgi:hypothetical protein